MKNSFESTDQTTVAHGAGTAGLRWLCSLADKHGVIITGTAIPNGSKRLNKPALNRWYKRHGLTVSSRGEISYMPGTKQ